MTAKVLRVGTVSGVPGSVGKVFFSNKTGLSLGFYVNVVLGTIDHGEYYSDVSEL